MKTIFYDVFVALVATLIVKIVEIWVNDDRR